MSGGDERTPGGPLGFDEDAEDRRRRLAHRQDPDELARLRAGPGARDGGPARMPAGTSRYGWFVGVVGILLIAYVSINAIRSPGPGSRGVPVGALAPPFAAPLAAGSLRGDVNVARRAGSGASGSVPACDVRGPEVLNACALWAARPAVLAFFATPDSRCTGQLDVLERRRGAHPGVAMAAVAIRGDRSRAAALVRSRGWRFPVGYDADGVLANLYAVAVCPQLVYVRRGGRIAGSTFGLLGAAGLDARLSALEAGRRLPGP